jgi:glycosyltransferase involved in cell wall biosynthesis
VLTLSIVIPAYNEERRLEASLDTLRGYLGRQPWDWDVLVVDDGSLDRTAAIVEQVARGEPRIALRREPHRGKGGAVRAGLLVVHGAFRFLCDADLSMPVENLARFLPPQTGKYDVAIGMREGVQAIRVGEPSYRHVIGRLFNRFVQSLALPGIEDSQCGFKMFSAAAAEAIFRRTTVDGWAFDVEALVIARSLGLSIVEIPIEWHYRADSRVSPVRDGMAMFAEVVKIRARHGRITQRR